ncbi:hypothetical protein F5877DRAFT_72598 [Lentinula edodes]|nr:hypothetical protein F5877DRAFT_72598 [Lentinula edodes]
MRLYTFTLLMHHHPHFHHPHGFPTFSPLLDLPISSAPSIHGSGNPRPVLLGTPTLLVIRLPSALPNVRPIVVVVIVELPKSGDAVNTVDVIGGNEKYPTSGDFEGGVGGVGGRGRDNEDDDDVGSEFYNFWQVCFCEQGSVEVMVFAREEEEQNMNVDFLAGCRSKGLVGGCGHFPWKVEVAKFKLVVTKYQPLAQNHFNLDLPQTDM